VEAAVQLLSQGDNKASQVHSDVGFRSRSAFYRCFVHVTGRKPSTYLRGSG
jgi:AraC-like DNA-binding protein